MPNALIFHFGDIGNNFRLLQHAKSFLMIPESHVYLVGSDEHTIPREIEYAPNLTFIPIFIFQTYSFFSFILFPIRLIFSIIQIFLISISISSIDFIFCSTENFLTDVICCYFISLIKKSKLIIDISPFKWMNPKRLYQFIFKLIETNQFKVADFFIVSTQAMQVILKFRKIKSVLIRDFPGTFFASNKELKNDVSEKVENSEKSLSIAVPINKSYKDEHNLMNYIEYAAKFLNENEIKAIFYVFGSLKNSFFNALSNNLSNSEVKMKFIEFRFYPINSYNYSSIMKSSDFGIILEGSKYGLDLTTEIIQIAACNLPVIVYKYGCVCEIFRESNSAFFFENKEEFIKIFQRIFIQKELSLHNQKICTSNQFNWTESWNNSVLKYINSNSS